MRARRGGRGGRPAGHSRRARLGGGSLVLLAAILAGLSHAVLADTAQRPAGAGPATALMSDVFGTALAFIAPRILDPTPVPTLASWGLNGISAVDPSLTASLAGGAIELRSSGGVLWSEKAPATDGAEAWGRAAANICGAAWQVSRPVRDAGAEGLIQAFFDELFNHLDPYSRYVGPEPAETERDRREGRGGIGARVVETRGGLALVEISPEGPAAGLLRDGDRLVAIDGVPIEGVTAAAAAALLDGPVGSTVRIRVRDGRGPARTLSLARAMVAPETVFAAEAGGVLTVRVTGFSRDTAAEISAALDAGMASRPQGVILDLRGNRGGLLQQAVTAAALVLDDGVAVVTQGRYPQSNHVWSVQGGDILRGTPMVVLVDGRTASAAEIVAAALADHGRAAVAGSSTFGKGLVQTILQLDDGGELFVTWSRVLAPLGWPIQGLGVLPQLCTGRGADPVSSQMRALHDGGSSLAGPLAAERAARPPVPVQRILQIRSACPAAIGADGDEDAARALLADPVAYRSAIRSVTDLAGAGDGADPAPSGGPVPLAHNAVSPPAPVPGPPGPSPR